MFYATWLPQEVATLVATDNAGWRQYTAFVLQVHGLCTANTWLLYSKYTGFVLPPEVPPDIKKASALQRMPFLFMEQKI
jgi:hypothetical protein